MNTLCITSIQHPALYAITELLHDTGLEHPKKLAGRSDIDIHGWHQRVLAKQPLPHDSSNLGRLWEQLAGELFMTNLDQPLWGWSDPNSAPLLDFWCEFDPQIRFLLIHIPLRDALAHAMAEVTPPLDVETLVKQWETTHQYMLRFQLRHPTRSLLIPAAAALDQPLDFVSYLIKNWNIPLNKLDETYQIAYSAPDEVARYLADRLCEQYPHAQALTLELESAQELLSETDVITDKVAQDLSVIIHSYRQLCDQSHQLEQAALERKTAQDHIQQLIEEHAILAQNYQKQIEDINQEKSTLTQACDNQSKLAQERQAQIEALNKEKIQLTQARDNQSKLAQERQAQIEALSKERDTLKTQANQLQQQITESQEENELLLLQLHQVQEELEKIFLEQQSLQEQTKELIQTRDNQSKLAQERQAQIEVLNKEKIQLTQARDNQSKLAQERQAQIEALNKEKTQLTQARDNQSKLAQERQAQIEALNKEKTQLTQAHDNQSKLAQERQAQIEALNKEKTQLTQAHDNQSKLAQERQAQIEALNKEKTQLTQAHDNQSKLAQERQAQIEALNKEKTQLTQARDNQSKLAQERQAQIEALSKERDTLKTQANQLQQQVTESQEENELLLLQLHQVQEELEQYFLQNQKATQHIETLELRWQRMLTRHPDYCDYSQIKANQSSDDSNTLYWHVENLETAGRMIDTLRCHTLIRNGLLGFCFSQADRETLPLLRQPKQNIADDLLFFPIDQRKYLSDALPPIQQLATSDRRLLRNLSRTFHQVLAQPLEIGLSADYPSAALRTALLRFNAALDALPAVLTYDACRLERQQVNPDYEHLWLRLENLALGTAQWPSFDVRISCANVGPDRFGTHPKLEFPKPEMISPLTGWYAESHDDFGPKFELRFALPEDMDVEAWKHLQKSDHIFIHALVIQLPHILTDLYTQTGPSLSRPCEDWIRLAQDTQRILFAHTATFSPSSQQTAMR
ncbi:hypothetical protein SAMN05421644_11160 [Allochromatium warmingii]|uniref:Uncharacterized protein n=1 Tax=Allochromatium warmingii TaxID=61595 RepID=A0A1H3E5H4_ALLWA|nr:hypothetical protein [Allochromatium warmingii]SDX73992.1 hypothetical protein SAMN05421644_11160 [Allochromatium warmingii]